MGRKWQSFLRGASTQLRQTWQGHRASSQHCIFFKLRISCCVFKRGGSKLSDVLNDAKFCTFWFLWKLREEWARYLCQFLKPYLRPNLQNTFFMAIDCATAEYDGLKIIVFQAVKLFPVSTNIWRSCTLRAVHLFEHGIYEEYSVTWHCVDDIAVVL